MSNKIPVITIDGPAGSGKGTIAQLLAQALGWYFLDSGSLYRVLALAASKQNIASTDEARLSQLALSLSVEFVAQSNDASSIILLKGEDVTEAIRSETCGNLASQISVLSGVRQGLLERQRVFRKSPGLVTDGRDMGTVVFPDAQLKIFLSASLTERASRRQQQLKAKGINVSLEALCDELAERDRRDQTRTVAPLKPAADAVIIDATHLSIDEVLQRVKKEWEKLSEIKKER